MTSCGVENLFDHMLGEYSLSKSISSVISAMVLLVAWKKKNIVYATGYRVIFYLSILNSTISLGTYLYHWDEIQKMYE